MLIFENFINFLTFFIFGIEVMRKIVRGNTKFNLV